MKSLVEQLAVEPDLPSAKPAEALPPVAEVLSQFRKILRPLTRTSKYTTTRVGVYVDGIMAPVLLILAQEKYGAYDATQFMAYWKDTNWANETWDNVGICARAISKPAGRPAGNKYGVPSGTPQYWKAYRKDRADRVKEWSLRARLKRKAVLDQILEEDIAEADLSVIDNLLRPREGNPQ